MKENLSDNTDIKKLHSIAEKLSLYLKKLNILTIGDLLWYFPNRYNDLSQVKKISELEDGEMVTIKVKILSIRSYRSFRSKMMITTAKASDGDDEIEATWFRQKFVGQILKVGDEVYFSGKAQNKNGKWTMTSPTYEKVKDNPLHSARLVPIYSLSGKLTQKQLRFLIDRALNLGIYMDDPLPVDILNQEKYPWLHDSLQQIHFPTDEKKLEAAKDRLKFQELFYLSCKYQLAKKNYKSQPSQKINPSSRILERLKGFLPFQLTKDQIQSLAEIMDDMQKDSPMNRLVEGDVGSGKTVVAYISAMHTIEAKLQAAFMAPTEVLANQHYKSAREFILPEYYSQTALLTRTQQQIAGQMASKRQVLDGLEDGSIKFVIGTHSLIQESIEFDNLGLVIIDEQHRFGVKQRQIIKEKARGKYVPHLLSMTATPIPRTLSLTLYGDLDISIIKEKPAGRQPVKTHLIPEKKRKDAYKFIREKIEEGQQAFIICPLIDESDSLGVKSVTQEYKKLNEKIFPDLDIRMIHGKLDAVEKENIMKDFQDNKFPILIATSVIEVGVDIPNATIILIEGSERFGLSQLHQFRGRVGRNDMESFCLLFATEDSQLSKERLKALVKSNDGFELSELDLQLRGAGEVFGTKQTGLQKLKIAKLSDATLIKKAQEWASKVIDNPKFQNDKLQKVLSEFEQMVHLE